MLKSCLLLLLLAHLDILSSSSSSSRNERALVVSAPIYQYDNFREGIVVFRNGSKQRARLNYNCTLARLTFIDDQKDTLLLTNKIRIRQVSIDGHQYLPGKTDDDDDLEVLATYPSIRLAQTRKVVVVGNGANASTQQFKADSTRTMPSVLLLASQGREFQWQNNTSMDLVRQKTQLYLVDNNERLYRTSYRNLTRLLRQKKTEIDRYLSQNTVNFEDVGQVRALIESVN